jgi:hypothetical protein
MKSKTDKAKAKAKADATTTTTTKAEVEAKVGTKKEAKQKTTTEKVASDAATEATKKEVEEERKRDEEAQNNDTNPMDTNILEISTRGASNHNPFGGLGLGFCTPFRANEVSNLKKFTYDKVSGRIVEEQVKKVPVTGGNPILVLTQTPITGNGSEDPITIASVGSSFTTTT